MAQLINYVRGQTSATQTNLTDPGSTIKVLVTNSGTAPMRVINNGFSIVKTDNSAFITKGMLVFAVRQNGSSASNASTTVGHKYWDLSASASVFLNSLEVPPGENLTSWSATATTPGNYNTVPDLILGALSETDGINTSLINTTNPNQNWRWIAAAQTYAMASGNATYTFQRIPPYFWLAPGDVLVARFFSPQAGSALMNYNFITISDSGG